MTQEIFHTSSPLILYFAEVLTIAISNRTENVVGKKNCRVLNRDTHAVQHCSTASEIRIFFTAFTEVVVCCLSPVKCVCILIAYFIKNPLYYIIPSILRSHKYSFLSRFFFAKMLIVIFKVYSLLSSHIICRITAMKFCVFIS